MIVFYSKAIGMREEEEERRPGYARKSGIIDLG
jgi:hypothetical protein